MHYSFTWRYCESRKIILAVLCHRVAQPIFTVSARNCRAISKVTRDRDVSTGVFVWTTTFFRVTRSFPPRGKAGSHDSLSLFPGTVGIDQKYISPRYDSAECFFFFGVGRRNGVESSRVLSFFSLRDPRGCTKVVVYLLGGKGFPVYLREKKPAGQINDLVSVPIFGVTASPPFFFTVISTPFPSMSLANGDRIVAFLFFATIFFLPRAREDVLWERKRTTSSSRKLFRQTDRNESKKDRVAGLAARHRDLRDIHLDTVRRWRDTSDVTRVEWRTPFSIICWSRATTKTIGWLGCLQRSRVKSPVVSGFSDCNFRFLKKYYLIEFF